MTVSIGTQGPYRKLSVIHSAYFPPWLSSQQTEKERGPPHSINSYLSLKKKTLDIYLQKNCMPFILHKVNSNWIKYGLIQQFPRFCVEMLELQISASTLSLLLLPQYSHLLSYFMSTWFLLPPQSLISAATVCIDIIRATFLRKLIPHPLLKLSTTNSCSAEVGTLLSIMEGWLVLSMWIF